ncbi:MAG: rRNA pseudouridine synthase [Erysipelotrichaceae bacterium]|nr:rRNA pseudouridine synthase [Erysipelotrichaceae bacterium]
MRLQKAMSQLGLCSRRQAEELINQGKVKVNGVLVQEMGVQVTLKDKIEIIGQSNKSVNTNTVTFLFNKPLGVVSSVKDDRGRKVVTDFFNNENYRLYPVGRLDYNTSGALLISNDGELTNLVTHPSTHLNKTYIVTIDSEVKDEHLKLLEKGVMLEDGLTQPSIIKVLKRTTTYSLISITIHEGRNRQVRRMFEHFSYHVKNLHRESIGFLNLNGIERGKYRLLTNQEVEKIKTICKQNKSKNIIPEYKRK